MNSKFSKASLLLAIVLVSVVALSPHVGTLASETKPNDFDAYLSQKGSPLGGYGETLDVYGQKYNVDPRLVIAIAGAETQFGTDGSNCVQYYNYWNFLTNGVCWQFDSIEDGIEQASAQLRQYREQRGLRTIKDIGTTFCKSGCEHWEANVKAFYSEQVGHPDPESDNLTYTFDLGQNGLDLWNYCQENHHVPRAQSVYIEHQPVWICASENSVAPINLNDACDQEFHDLYVTTSPSGNYPHPGIHAYSSDLSNPNSWECHYNTDTDHAANFTPKSIGHKLSGWAKRQICHMVCQYDDPVRRV